MTQNIDRQAQRSILDQIKLAAGCERCGYNESPVALQFDHVDPTNKHTTTGGIRVHISNMVGRYGLDTILAEIAKCRILCANCHSIVTHTGNS